MGTANNNFRELMIYALTIGDVLKETSDAKKYKRLIKKYVNRIISEKEAIISADPDTKGELDYITGRNRLSVFNAPFEEKYDDLPIDIAFDKSASLKYIVHNGKRLYFQGSVRNTYIRMSYRSVCCEQDPASPHRYLDSGEDLKDTVLFDCGCAEANFSLDHIDQVKSVHLFEGDKKWFEPLSATFSPWENKVTLIKKFVGKESEQTISLRKYIEKLIDDGKLVPEEDKVFIKMDIEGSEVDVMEDILPLFDMFRHLRMAVCVYHRAEHEETIRKMLPPDYTGRVRNGHMFFVYEMDLPGGKMPEFPYFRHGVMRIERLSDAK